MTKPRVVKKIWNYMKLDLQLTDEQKAILETVLKELERVKRVHTPPPPEHCPECGREKINFVDTWSFSDIPYIKGQINAIKAIIGKEVLHTDHT